MSTIHLPSRLHSETPLSRPQAPPALPSSADTHAAALQALLESGPNSARAPKLPDNPAPLPAQRAAMEREINALGAQLGRKMVEGMLRSPDTAESQAYFNKIDTLLTPDTLKGVLNGPNPKACTQALTLIETQLNKNAINSALNPIETEQVEAYRNYIDSAMFNLKASLMSAPPETRFEMVRAFSRREHAPLTNIQHYINTLKDKSEHLCDIATQVREAIGALQFAHPEEWRKDDYREPAGALHARTYSFAHMNESTLEHPSEIRNFVTGRDKLDLSGIGRQLNKPLQCVNRLSGHSGEIQLHYSRAKNTSVVSVSDNRGQTAFVVKVFGQVKERDLSV